MYQEQKERDMYLALSYQKLYSLCLDKYCTCLYISLHPNPLYKNQKGIVFISALACFALMRESKNKQTTLWVFQLSFLLSQTFLYTFLILHLSILLTFYLQQPRCVKQHLLYLTKLGCYEVASFSGHSNCRLQKEYLQLFPFYFSFQLG